MLRYSPDTGVFIRLVCTANRHSVGEVVGSKDRSGYLRITLHRKQYWAHRLAWLYVFGEMPNVIDHENGIRSDNRISNLRGGTQRDNLRNLSLPKTNKTGLIGVRRRGDYDAWTAEIGGGESRQRLGTFRDFFEAACARKSAELRLGYHPNHGRR